MLYPAQKLAHLKQLSHRYVQLRDSSGASTSSFGLRTSVSAKPKPSSDNKASASASVSDLRCYNCSGLGHLAANCKEPKRIKGSCFRCGSTQHVLKNCPKPVPHNNNQVALVAEYCSGFGLGDGTTDEMRQSLPDSNEVSEFNNVSVTFLTDSDCDISNTLLSLFDSGSSVNLIAIGAIPDNLVNNQTQPTKYGGLGNFKLCTYGIVKIRIKFRNLSKIISVYVVPNNFNNNNLMNIPLLLGRDALRKLNIKLCMSTHTPKPVVEFDKINNKLKISGHVLHCVYDSFSKNKLVPEGNNSSCSIHGHAHSASVLNALSGSSHSVSLGNLHEKDSVYDGVFNISVNDSETNKYDINPKLNVFHREAIQKIINDNYSDTSKIPAVKHDYKVQIRLTSDQPMSYAPRRTSHSDRNLIDKTIDELLQQGIIRPSTSPYAFPIVMVPKKDGTKRMCIDYKPLNKIMIRDSYPLSIVDDCLKKLEGQRYFTTLDLKNGFHQILMSEESIPYTSFVAHSGQYEYTRLPFGLKIGPSKFQRFMNFVLREFIKDGSVIPYMDDFTLVSKTIPEHLDLLTRVLRRLAEYRLEIKPEKCKFCCSEIELLGFTVSSSGIRPNNKHLEAIQRLPFPKNAHEVQKCLGLFSFFRRFIMSYSTVSAPLRHLTKPNVPFVFDEQCKSIFRSLCDQLVSSPVLSIYSPFRETELHCDASALGYGGILLQKQDDGKFHPVAYFSRATRGNEPKYHSYELETLAVVYSIKKFHTKLDGIPFRIITDCDSLARTLEKVETSPRIARWSLFLDHYDYTIKHRSGSLMGHVDALSRYHPISNENFVPQDKMISIINYEDIDIQLRAMQNRDEKILKLRNELENKTFDNYALENGLVYRKLYDFFCMFRRN